MGLLNTLAAHNEDAQAPAVQRQAALLETALENRVNENTLHRVYASRCRS